MVIGGVLRGCFLLCLLFRGGETQNVDQNTLARIIKYIQDKFSPGIGVQYAVAINIPADQCAAGFIPGQDFLTGNDPENVKKVLNDRDVYQSSTMIGAMPKSNAHSESRLLNSPNQASPMQNLLNKNSNGCVIFYTYNSPCLNTCLNEQSPYNILKALKMFNNRNRKAFVFSKIFGSESRDDRRTKFLKVNKEIFLYHCTDERCNPCFNGEAFSDVC